MPSAANGDIEKHASQQVVDNSPVRRVVEILQMKIAGLEKQKNKLTSRDVKSGKESTEEQKVVGLAKSEEISQMIEFVWDLCKQVMGIAILSENEAKKQARKESALRKTQDVELVQEVLLVLDCLEQLSEPCARSDFLTGSCGATQLTAADLQALDDIYPEVTPKHDPEDGETFMLQSSSAARHLVAIVDGVDKEVTGTTYARLKTVVGAVHSCGYFDRSRETPQPEEPVPEAPEEEEEEEPVEEAEVPAPVLSALERPAPPPPAPRAVPAPSFPALPPHPAPVTLQQVEQAYFSRQYGHRQAVPEVFGPQSFIFLQESEIDCPEIAGPPSPGRLSPAPIPSQTFTNQSFSAPPRPFDPEPHTVPVPQQPSPCPPAAPHPAGFPVADPPPPIPMPPARRSLPLGRSPPDAQSQSRGPQRPRLPSPSFRHGASRKRNSGTRPSDGDPRSSPPARRGDSSAERLEIDDWNPSDGRGGRDGSDNDNRTDRGRFRPRGRGGRGAPTGNYRGRGGFQNQNGRGNGAYGRSDGYQNGDGGDEGHADGGRFEGSPAGGYQSGGSRGRGTGARGGGQRPRGAPRPAAPRGPPRSHYPRRADGNSHEAGNEGRQYAD